MAAHEALSAPLGDPLIPEDSFAVRLIIIRKALGITQADAATRCGFDDGSWSNWENGTHPRGMDRIVETIAERLHIDRDWLMWGGPLRTGSFSPLLSCLEDVPGQGTLLDEDLTPVDYWSRAVLEVVG